MYLHFRWSLPICGRGRRREGGKGEGGSKGGREQGGREGAREGGRKLAWEGASKGGREGGRKGGKEGEGIRYEKDRDVQFIRRVINSKRRKFRCSSSCFCSLKEYIFHA